MCTMVLVIGGQNVHVCYIHNASGDRGWNGYIYPMFTILINGDRGWNVHIS